MADVKLVGNDDDTYTTGYFQAVDTILLVRFQAVKSGTLKSIRIKGITGYSSAVKVAIYTDSSGPTTRLSTGGPTTVNAGSWFTIDVSNISLTSGTYYWLGAICDNNNIGYKAGTDTIKYKTGDYTSGPPSPAGTGYSDLNGSYKYPIAGWGEESGIVPILVTESRRRR